MRISQEDANTITRELERIWSGAYWINFGGQEIGAEGQREVTATVARVEAHQLPALTKLVSEMEYPFDIRGAKGTEAVVLSFSADPRPL